MDRRKINRINELAAKVKAGETLTPEELAERDALRREYLDAIRANFKATLDSVKIK
jgi:uncharacterized protein YnzC (UPF0291/DUF896 family)